MRVGLRDLFFGTVSPACDACSLTRSTGDWTGADELSPSET